MLCITLAHASQVRCSFLSILLICECIVSGGGSAQNTVQQNCWNLLVGTQGSRASRLLLGGHCPIQAPLMSSLTSCSYSTVSVSGGGPPSGHGRRGYVFDLPCRYQKVSCKSNQATATNVVDTIRFRTSRKPSYLSEVFAQAPLSELFIATVSDFLM